MKGNIGQKEYYEKKREQKGKFLGEEKRK